MAGTVRIELDHDGIKDLLCSEEVGKACEAAAEKVAARAGAGFEVTLARQLPRAGRAGAGVKAATREAKLAEAENKVLSKAVSACRL